MPSSSLEFFSPKVNNYAEDATTVTAHWIDTTHCVFYCPTGKRWRLQGGIINRDVNGTLNVLIRDASDQAIYFLSSKTAGTGQTGYPDVGTAGQSGIFLVDADEYIQATFGAAQGATAYMSCVVLEFDV